MNEIGAWLESIGLGRYAAAFAENDIDLDVLPHLTDADLEGLGLSLGHRRKLQAALSSPTSGEAESSRTSASSPPAPSPAEAERRQLTVLFCDLVGSTALSARLDPEDMRDVLRAYQDACSGVIARYDGYVAKFMGDGVYAYFGYPVAHEDDAERAINAGLDMVAAVSRLPNELAARIGIATGTVAVGDIVGAGASEEAAIVGDAPNLAGRLQEIAEPNTVVIGEATHALAGGLFETADLGRRDVKGFDRPLGAWAVAGVRRTESRFEAIRGERLTELIGRDEEIEILLRRWQRAKAGEGQVVLISGEPGIGKSRLTRELRERIADQPHLRLRYQCSPYHTNSALHPIIEQLERGTGFEPADGAAVKLDKLEAEFGLAGKPAAEAVPLIAALLSIPFEDRYPPLNLSPQRQKELTLELLADQLVVLARRQPVLFVMEDVHWMDPTSLELMELAVDRVPDAAILALITHRQEFDAPWVGRPRVTPMILARLELSDCAAMVERVWSREGIPEELRNRIAIQTDGIPLFVEELTRSVLESAAGSAEPTASIAVPATLQDSLEARLDRLGPAKEVAQIGAVIGRSFDYDLLARVVRHDEATLNSALEALVGSGLATVRGAPPDATYTFKHALLQDTAYASLLRGRRAEIHSAVAATLKESFPETASSEPELLAHHFTEAGLTDQAVDYWQRAGTRAAQRSADVEAIVHFEKAAELLGTLPESPDRDARELELQIALTTPIIAVKGYASPELDRSNARALALSDRADDVEDVFPVLYGRWAFLYTSGRIAESVAWAEQVGRRAEGREEALPRIVSHRFLGTSLLMAGNPMAARENLERALDLVGTAGDEVTGFVYGQDIRVALTCYHAMTLWYLGYPDQAIQRVQEALARAREIRHVNTLSYVYYHFGVIYGLALRFDELDALGQELIDISERNGLELWRIIGHLYRARRSVAEAADRNAAERFEAGLAAYRGTQMGVFVPEWNTVLALAYAEAGETERGLKILGEALALVEETGQRIDEAAIHRAWGELEILRHAPREAEKRFRRAIDVARSQSARPWELRAATSLARLWQSEGRTGAARDVLAPVYGWFTEGFDMAALKEARSMLDALG